MHTAYNNVWAGDDKNAAIGCNNKKKKIKTYTRVLYYMCLYVYVYIIL